MKIPCIESVYSKSFSIKCLVFPCGLANVLNAFPWYITTVLCALLPPTLDQWNTVKLATGKCIVCMHIRASVHA